MREDLLCRAEQLHELTLPELTALLADADPAAEAALAAAADRVRAAFVGAGVHLRGLIEFSNICRQSCIYCRLRRDNAAVDRLGLDE